MKEFNLNSNLFWHLVKPDSYIEFSDERVFDIGYELDGYPTFLCNELPSYFRQQEYVKALAEVCLDVYDKFFPKGIEIDRNTLEVFSPTYYNYSTDRLDVVARMSDDCFDMLVSFAKENETAFAKYLKEFNSSYDGFISFLPNTIEELENEKNEDFSKYVSILLDYYIYANFSKEEIKKQVVYVYESMNDNYLFFDFINNIDYVVKDIIDFDIKYNNGSNLENYYNEILAWDNSESYDLDKANKIKETFIKRYNEMK